MEEIRFVPENHSYWIGDKCLESVTTLIKSLSKPFDRERISKYSAVKAGVSQDEILEQWEKKAEIGRERGTMVHSYIDDVFEDKHDILLSQMNVKIPEMTAFDNAWAAFRERLRAKVSRREFIVGSSELGVAGRIDVILQILLSDGEERNCLFDWKTGKFERSNRFEKLLAPFDDQDDCELVKYSLQLSMYRLILEKSGIEKQLGDSYLVHLKSDGTFFIHRAIDYRDRLHSWLTYRTRENGR